MRELPFESFSVVLSLKYAYIIPALGEGVVRSKTSYIYLGEWLSRTWQLAPIFYCQSALLCACMRLTTRLLSMPGEVAATLAVGRRLRGAVGSYKVLEQFTKDRDVWKAMWAIMPCLCNNCALLSLAD